MPDRVQSGMTPGWNRRKFLTVSLLSTAAVGLTLRASSQERGQPARLRTITYNILGCHGYSEMKEGAEVLKLAESQIPSRLALELALYEPDIVTFQEAPREETVAAIARQLSFNYGFFASGYKSSRKGSIGFPGAILSRFKIANLQNCPLDGKSRPEDLFTRHWGRAVLASPAGELVVYSAHLHPSNVDVRMREVDAVLDAMRPDMARGVAMLLQGDLNHEPEAPEYDRWKKAGLLDIRPAESGKTTLTFGSHKPSKRIDYIWVHGPLASRKATCKVLYEGAFRTNWEDPRSFALSDHIPVFAEFR